MTSRDRFLVSNRLRYHAVEWGDAGPTVLLLHGFLEHAHGWDLVAPRLAEAGFHVLALDWRGHGDTDWVGAGGYYHFPDYAADLGGIVRALDRRVALVGHSMGAGGAVLYAGTEPARVTALACIDALGPPDTNPAEAPTRYVAWLEDLDKIADRPRVVTTLPEATARLRERFPRFSAEVAAHMALHGTRQTDDGGRVWKFDPLHQTTAPTPYYVSQARHFWIRIACPALYVAGAESPYRLDPETEAARLEALRAERVVMPGVAHHPHLEAPQRTAGILIDFLRRTPCAD